MECLKLIGPLGDEEIFTRAIIRGLKDRYELLRAVMPRLTHGGRACPPGTAARIGRHLCRDSESKRVAFPGDTKAGHSPGKLVEQALRARPSRLRHIRITAARLAELREEVARTGDEGRQQNLLFSNTRRSKANTFDHQFDACNNTITNWCPIC